MGNCASSRSMRIFDCDNFDFEQIECTNRTDIPHGAGSGHRHRERHSQEQKTRYAAVLCRVTSQFTTVSPFNIHATSPPLTTRSHSIRTQPTSRWISTVDSRQFQTETHRWIQPTIEDVIEVKWMHRAMEMHSVHAVGTCIGANNGEIKEKKMNF